MSGHGRAGSDGETLGSGDPRVVLPLAHRLSNARSAPSRAAKPREANVLGRFAGDAAERAEDVRV